MVNTQVKPRTSTTPDGSAGLPCSSVAGTHADIVLQLGQQVKLVSPGAWHLCRNPGPHLGRDPLQKVVANTTKAFLTRAGKTLLTEQLPSCQRNETSQGSVPLPRAWAFIPTTTCFPRVCCTRVCFRLLHLLLWLKYWVNQRNQSA